MRVVCRGRLASRRMHILASRLADFEHGILWSVHRTLAGAKGYVVWATTDRQKTGPQRV